MNGRKVKGRRFDMFERPDTMMITLYASCVRGALGPSFNETFSTSTRSGLSSDPSIKAPYFDRVCSMEFCNL